jgi:cation diffusion facilitator CzcD-associated flavoprotein CzcO
MGMSYIMSTPPVEHLDVLIVGAGLSGIGAACHLKTQHPGKRYAILESRGEIGGTWSLFQYPGIRSDSDMYTFGYSFRPFTSGYVLRSLDQFPKQSGKVPWRLRQNYLVDLLNLRLRAIDDGTLVFSKGRASD